MDAAITAALVGGVAGLIVSIVSQYLQARETNKRERRQAIREAYAKFTGLFFESLTLNKNIIEQYNRLAMGERPSPIDVKKVALQIEEYNIRLHEAEAIIYMVETNNDALQKFLKVADVAYPLPENTIIDIEIHKKFRTQKISEMKAFLNWRAKLL